MDTLTTQLTAATDEVLLTTFAALTHSIHGAGDSLHLSRAAELREQRDEVKAEVLRRMGGRS